MQPNTSAPARTTHEKSTDNRCDTSPGSLAATRVPRPTTAGPLHNPQTNAGNASDRTGDLGRAYSSGAGMVQCTNQETH